TESSTVVSADLAGADHRAEALQALEDLGEALAAEVKDDLAHAEPRERRDVLRDLRRAPGERPSLAARELTLAHVVHRRLVRDRQGFGVAPLGRGEPMELLDKEPQLRRWQRDGGVGADGMPAVTEARRPSQGGLAVAADPDRRVRCLDRLGPVMERAELIEASGE